MPTLDPLKAAKALVVMAEEKVNIGRVTATGWECWSKEYPLTPSLSTGQDPIDALAAAYDALYPDKEPDVVVVPLTDADAPKRLAGALSFIGILADEMDIFLQQRSGSTEATIQAMAMIDRWRNLIEAAYGSPETAALRGGKGENPGA